MRVNTLIAAFVVVVTAAGATGVIWHNQPDKEDLSVASTGPGAGLSRNTSMVPAGSDQSVENGQASSGGNMAGNDISPAAEKPAKTEPSQEEPNPPTETAAVNPAVVIGKLSRTEPDRQSFMERDTRVSLAFDKADPDAPRIDVVRIDAQGMAIIAGHGLPGSDVDVLIGGKIVTSLPVESSGSFATVLQTPVKAGSQIIKLQGRTADRVISGPEEVTVLLPGDLSRQKPLVLVSEPDQPTRVVQRPDSLPGRTGLSLDVIDYDHEGRVVFSGSAGRGLWVRAQINAETIGKIRAEDNGRWSMVSPAKIAPGRYIVHLEELDNEAGVLRRTSFPFERARLEQIVFTEGEMIVQPGQNLWNIAKANYGSGFNYTIIYSANAGKISDPDLIYPGQILDLPGN